MQGGGDAAILCCYIINDLVDLFGTHSDVDLLCDRIQHRGIQGSAFFDLFNLEWSF